MTMVGGTASRTEGEGPDIIFVHGNGSTHETWQGTVGHLTDAFRCTVYDLRGHGHSDAIRGELTLDTLVEDLEQLRAALGIERAFVVGHSLGSFIAAAYARKYPRHVDRLCLMAMPANRTGEDRQSTATLIEKIKRNGVKETVSNLIKNWYTDPFVVAHPAQLQRRLDQLLSIEESTFISAYELYNRTEIDAWLPAIAVPTLVMTGEFAKGCAAETAQYTANSIPRAKLVIFPQMKNGILTEIPDRVANELAVFANTAAHYF
jgi:pimeloyl-ACP methyl ester carboxylesterase